MQANYRNQTGVIVTAGVTANSLGVVRGFGRRGIRVIYLDTERGSIARYSKYINQRLKCRSPKEPETELISVLLAFGKQIDSKMMIIPTGDKEVIVFSKYKKKLEEFYLVPVPSYDIVQNLVNKKRFYKLLAELKVPHPKTYFPENITELFLMGREINYPYIIKPAYSSPFQEAFHRKCFLINSSQELDYAVERLKGKNFQLMIQEIICGKETYEFYTYFNKESEPLAICGWDKIRHYPPDFGSGSFCKSVWRSSAIERGILLLKAIGYYGFAAPELKKDPRDGKYKLIEINARTILQNRLSAACGVDIEYIAYLDATGRHIRDSVLPHNNVLWVDDFTDTVSRFMHLKRKEVTIGEIVKLLKDRKLHSVAAWDDPAPLIARTINLSLSALTLLFSNLLRLLRIIMRALIA
jgi:predicted ATP-grasp superfamily ATP-dependent carboligase